MRKILKASVVLCLVVSLFSSMALAGNSPVSRYLIYSNGYTRYEAYGSENTKATTQANWFMNVEKVDFAGGNTSGTLGMAYTPLINSKQAGGIHWTKYPHSNYVYTGWAGYNGASGNRYILGVRMDSLITGVSGASTTGWWNSN